MTKSDPFGFDMRASADKKKRQKTRRGMSGAFETSTRVCEHPGCDERGQYRAPKNPDSLDDYYWFCKAHVREYNLKWNFFNGTTEEEFAEQVKSDTVGERPTRPFRQSVEEKAWARLGINDAHEVLGGNATQNPGRAPGRRRPPPAR
ncbi:MAG: molecular chaperone DnaJ, partial [Hasllibacter sp.]